jgi:DNA modification methylase
MCVTSPPYWGLRDYGVEGQIGLEKTPEEYVAKLVSVFANVRRLLRDDGTCWVNLGDSYAGTGGGTQGVTGQMADRFVISARRRRPGNPEKNGGASDRNGLGPVPGFKSKDRIGIPWRVAFALQAHGWYLRSDIIWHKPNPMPESVTDRPTQAHEYVFLLSKLPTYYYDADAIREPVSRSTIERFGDTERRRPNGKPTHEKIGGETMCGADPRGRNARSVWTIQGEPCPDAHFAVYPSALPRRCILAGSKPGDVVLDPFGGSGTTGRVAVECGRNAILIELNPEYVKLAESRTAQRGLGL